MRDWTCESPSYTAAIHCGLAGVVTSTQRGRAEIRVVLTMER